MISLFISPLRLINKAFSEALQTLCAFEKLTVVKEESGCSVAVAGAVLSGNVIRTRENNKILRYRFIFQSVLTLGDISKCLVHNPERENLTMGGSLTDNPNRHRIGTEGQLVEHGDLPSERKRVW